ncbi:MAG: hypothetical protein KDN19_24195, partial [Verrucomicrobiae bacterium]|nr:hypothetical protein [Verrucomicrobiae bacterium]
MKIVSSSRVRVAVLAALAAGAATPAFAQVYTPPAQKNTPPASGGGGNNTTIVNRQAPQSNNQVAGNDMPWLDPATNVFSFDGKTFNIQDNQIFRSRFEKYLNSAEAESEQAKAYRQSIRKVLDALSPHKKPDITTAVANLQYSAEFPQDARLCESLANAVYRVFLARRNVYNLQLINEELDRKRKQLDWN